MKVYEFGDKNAPAQGEIHIFYALKMGEKYRNRYLRSGRRKFSIRFSDDKKLDGFNRPIFCLLLCFYHKPLFLLLLYL